MNYTQIRIKEVTLRGFYHYCVPVADAYSNSSSVSCDFEEADICHYKQDRSSDTEDWQWGNGATYVEFTGPNTDHTRGDELGKALDTNFKLLRMYARKLTERRFWFTAWKKYS